MCVYGSVLQTKDTRIRREKTATPSAAVAHVSINIHLIFLLDIQQTSRYTYWCVILVKMQNSLGCVRQVHFLRCPNLVQTSGPEDWRAFSPINRNGRGLSAQLHPLRTWSIHLFTYRSYMSLFSLRNLVASWNPFPHIIS